MLGEPRISVVENSFEVMLPTRRYLLGAYQRRSYSVRGDSLHWGCLPRGVSVLSVTYFDSGRTKTIREISVAALLLLLGNFVLCGCGNATKERERFAQDLAKAEQGDLKAHFLVGNGYLLGKGVDKDLKEAEAWFSKGSVAGDIDCAMALGILHVEGMVETPNLTMAAKLFERAHEAGDKEAGAWLGIMYVEGNGVIPDMKKGHEYVRTAAYAGSLYGQYYYGLLHALGIGTEKDLVEACAWFEISKSEWEESETTLEEYLPKLTPEQAEALDVRIEEIRQQINSQNGGAA